MGVGTGVAVTPVDKQSFSDANPPTGYSLAMQFPAEIKAHVSGHHEVWHHPLGTGVAVGPGVPVGVGRFPFPMHRSSDAYPPGGYSNPTQLPLEIRAQATGHHEVWQYPLPVAVDAPPKHSVSLA